MSDQMLRWKGTIGFVVTEEVVWSFRSWKHRTRYNLCRVREVEISSMNPSVLSTVSERKICMKSSYNFTHLMKECDELNKNIRRIAQFTKEQTALMEGKI